MVHRKSIFTCGSRQGSLGGCQLCSMHPTSINFRLKKVSLCLVWFIEDKKYLFVVRIALNGVRVTKFESGSHSDSTALKESPQKSGSHKSPVEALKVSAQEDLCRHDTVVAGSRQGR